MQSLRPWRTAVAAVLVIGVMSILWLLKGSEIQTLAMAVAQHGSVTSTDRTLIALSTNTIVEMNSASLSAKSTFAGQRRTST
jgi:hypothetical protein